MCISELHLKLPSPDQSCLFYSLSDRYRIWTGDVHSSFPIFPFLNLRKGPREKYLNIHDVMPEIFLALPPQAPCFRCWVLLKEEQSPDPAEMEMAEFGKLSARAMCCIVAPVEGVWGAAGPLSRQGSPTTWVWAQTGRALWQPCPGAPLAKTQHRDAHRDAHRAMAAFLAKPICSTRANLKRRDSLRVQVIRAQAPGMKSQAHEFAQWFWCKKSNNKEVHQEVRPGWSYFVDLFRCVDKRLHLNHPLEWGVEALLAPRTADHYLYFWCSD